MKLRDGVPASVLVDMARALAAGLPGLARRASEEHVEPRLRVGLISGCESQPFMLGVARRECNRAGAAAVSRRRRRGSARGFPGGRRRGAAVACDRSASLLA